MKVNKLTISIETIQEFKIECFVSDETENMHFEYFPEDATIHFAEQNHLSQVIVKHQFQFDKIIRSALKGKLNTGQTINCVFIDGFPFLNDADYSGFIRMDRRNAKLEISTNETETKGLHKIYADGSFSGKTKQAAFGGFIEYPNGIREVFHQSFNKGGSNLMELLAVSEGLKRLQKETKIQVNTDSRFVIRGLIQWVHFWRYNNWQTAYGSGVKFEKHWRNIDALCAGKFIEFNWIKGHSGHLEQDFCHQLAKQLATNPAKGV